MKREKTRAFLLLEAVVALALAGLVFGTALVCVARSISAINSAVNLRTAVSIAEEKLSELELSVYRNKSPGSLDGREGIFGFHCTASETERKGLVELRVTVTWKEKQQTKDISAGTLILTKER